MDEFNNRITILRDGIEGKGPVIYWMSRDQRIHDNYALLYAQKLAREKKRPLGIIFTLASFLPTWFRQYDFMLQGLAEAEREAKGYNIPFFVLQGEPAAEVSRFIECNNASFLVSDFDPLKIKQEWKRGICEKISEAFSSDPVDWNSAYKSIDLDMSVGRVDWIKPGEHSAHLVLQEFLAVKLNKYANDRNDPGKNSQSGLSPYLHFGQISAQRIALEVVKSGGDPESEKAFLEELIIRRELSDNYCYYNKNYDNVSGFPDWARETLKVHEKDKREFNYTMEQFENADTYEDLWNAAQKELISTGKIHGYMRMYWAKKILEWSASPKKALSTALYLNDKYALDGRDPNGYTGCAWSIGGVHDRPWTERKVFGKIRYMNRNGAKSKFDINAYIKKFDQNNVLP